MAWGGWLGGGWLGGGVISHTLWRQVEKPHCAGDAEVGGKTGGKVIKPLTIKVFSIV